MQPFNSKKAIKQTVKQTVKIAPSILSGDFGHLAEEAKKIEAAGADALHIDIMDGHFVPNLTLGPQAVAAINRATKLFLDVHIMIYNPFDFIERFVEAGADRIIFHFEATEQIEETIAYIHKCNIEAGLAFNPETSIEFATRFLTLADLILLMTVHPGAGGQAFIPEVVSKIESLQMICDKLKVQIPIAVDGGINPETAKSCVKAGASVLIAGNYLFKEVKVMSDGIQQLRG